MSYPFCRVFTLLPCRSGVSRHDLELILAPFYAQPCTTATPLLAYDPRTLVLDKGTGHLSYHISGR
jgi:hypothetical protein